MPLEVLIEKLYNIKILDKIKVHSLMGTTLAMLIPPIGLLATWAYYKQGYVNFSVAGLICLGFILGGYFGAKLAIGFPEVVLRKTFGVCLLLIASYMIIK